MVWISVNSRTERWEIISAAKAVSGWFQDEGQGGNEESCDKYYEKPGSSILKPEITAALYNNADGLDLDIYTVSHREGEGLDDWGLNDDDENGPGLM